MVLVFNSTKIISDVALEASKKWESIDLPKQDRVRDELEQTPEEIPR